MHDGPNRRHIAHRGVVGPGIGAAQRMHLPDKMREGRIGLRLEVPASTTKLHTLRLPLSNVHLAASRKVVLIDTGSPGDARRILRWLDRLGLGAPAAILLTHGHADHAGSAAALRIATGAPIYLAAPDWPMVEAGKNRPLRATRRSAIPLKYMVPDSFPAFTPDVALTEGGAEALGLDATILSTPGHTPGSASLVFPDGRAVVGDLLMGGYLGGTLWPRRPRPHYFADEPDRIAPSLARVLALGATTLLVGHGGPLSVADLLDGKLP